MNYSRRYLPNLQLMKLYRYLKYNGEVAKLLQHPEQYQECTEVYLRAEHRDSPILDDRFFVHEKLHLGGAYFTNGKYNPFAEEIEKCVPDYRLYKEYILIPREDKMTANTLVNSGYIRLSLGPDDWATQVIPKRHLYIYDEDLMSYLPELKEVSKTPGRIGFNHPFVINNLEDYETVKEMAINNFGRKLIRNHFGILFKIPMNTDQYTNFLNQQQEFISKYFAALGFTIYAQFDSRENLQYNIIETIKKMCLFIRIFGMTPGLYYVSKVYNPYAQFCAALEDYTFYLQHRRKHNLLLYLRKDPEHQQLLREMNLLINYDDLARYWIET